MSNQTSHVPSHMPKGVTLSNQPSRPNQQQGPGSGKPNQPRDSQKPAKGGQRS
jgi:hypothetical protein